MSSNRIVPWYVPHVVFILAGIIIFGIAFKIAEASEQTKLWVDIIKDFGVVITALAVTDIVWKFVGGDPVTGELMQLRNELSRQVGQLRAANELGQSAHEAGLIFMSASPTVGVQRWKDMFTSSQRKIDLSGLTLLEIVDNQELLEALRDKISKKVEIRILLNDPDHNTLDFMIDNKAQADTLIQMALEKLSKLGKEVQTHIDVKATFKIRLLKTKVLQIAVRRFDERIFIMHYMHSQTSPRTPMYIIEDSDKPLFKIYAEEFDWLFNHSTDFDWSAAPNA